MTTEKTFTPCKGKTACRDDGERCLVCGRDFTEILATRDLIDAITDFVLTQDYANPEDFTAYLARKVDKKVRHRRGEPNL